MGPTCAPSPWAHLRPCSFVAGLPSWFRPGGPPPVGRIFKEPNTGARDGELRQSLSPHHDASDPIRAQSRPVFHWSGVLFLISVALVPLGLVKVKMCRSITRANSRWSSTCPTARPLSRLRAWPALGDELARQPDVLNYQTYTGTSGPYNFNGLVRHYYMRRQPNQADIQVNLLPAKQRREQAMPLPSDFVLARRHR